MSFEYKRSDCRVVVCDICSKCSYVGDRQWRLMPHQNAEQPIHLCPECRLVAIYCAAHQQYHLPQTMHRHACADCGGLFTSVVRDRITQCPGCRRAAGQPSVPAAQAPAQPARSWLQVLLSPRAGHHQ